MTSVKVKELKRLDETSARRLASPLRPSIPSQGEQTNIDDQPALTPAPEPEVQPATDDVATPARRSRRRLLLAVAGALAVAGIATVGVPYAVHASHFESTDDAFVEAHVTSIGTKLSGYVQDVRVDDNQHVTKGQLIVQIDPRDQQSRLAQAQANLKSAESRLKESQTQLQASKADFEQAKAQVVAAQANADFAKTELNRFESMQEGAYSPQERSNAQAASRAADANVLAAQSKATASQSAIATAASRVETASSEIDLARTQVAQAELDLSYAQLTAPVSGRVTRKSVEPGAYVQAGQSLLAIVPDEPWIVANFKETQLTHMRVGQPAEIHVDAYPGRTFKAHVDSIQSGTGSRFSLLPPENATGNYVKVVQRVPVKIVPDEPFPADLTIAPGMSVEPEVRVK